MYGMIHRAVYDFVIDQHNEDEWETVKSALNVERDGMVSTFVYSDEQTMRLIKNAARLVGVDVPEFLCRLGAFWIMFSESGPYRQILDFTGDDLASFIKNLDKMHQAVISSTPKADVPSFTLVKEYSGELVVDYRSKREGLEPFVIGLLQGLLARFEHVGNVAYKGRLGDASRFVIRYDSQG